jgi:serine/threonine protein kinase
MSSDRSVNPGQTIDLPKQASEPSTVDQTGTYTAAPAAVLSAKPSVPTDLPVIAGYEITAEIARGGMGRVFAGRDLTLDREVAIKTLFPGGDAERFVTESKITARLPHPGIPPVHALDGVKNCECDHRACLTPGPKNAHRAIRTRLSYALATRAHVTPCWHSRTTISLCPRRIARASDVALGVKAASIGLAPR